MKWIKQLFQSNIQRYSFHIVGFSRGANWALELVSKLFDSHYFFERILLIAPYFKPCQTINDDAYSEESASYILQKIQQLHFRDWKAFLVVFGDRDEWLPNPTKDLMICKVMNYCCLYIIKGIDHLMHQCRRKKRWTENTKQSGRQHNGHDET